MTRVELLEQYLKPTDLTVKELIDRNSFAQIMQFVEAYHLEQLRIGGVRKRLLDAYEKGVADGESGRYNPENVA